MFQCKVKLLRFFITQINKICWWEFDFVMCMILEHDCHEILLQSTATSHCHRQILPRKEGVLSNEMVFDTARIP